MAHDHGEVRDLKLKLGIHTSEGTLDPVARALGRKDFGDVEFFGYDLWNAYEVSFLTPAGLPRVYHMQAVYDADSPNIVESKSFKLFLNAQNHHRFNTTSAFEAFVTQSLSQTVGAPVQLTFFEPDASPERVTLGGLNLDRLEPSTISHGYDPGLLRRREKGDHFHFRSHLLRSNCPVTHQPDWGAVDIRGTGDFAPDPASMLAYIIAFRDHQDFHESCCERIFCDLRHLLNPETLQVACYYTRRGGLDINPIRSTHPIDEIQRNIVWRQ